MHFNLNTQKPTYLWQRNPPPSFTNPNTQIAPITLGRITWHTRGTPHPTKISPLRSDISAGAPSVRPGPLVTQGQVFSSFLRAQHHTGWRTFGVTATELTNGFLNLSIAYRFNGRTLGVPPRNLLQPPDATSRHPHPTKIFSPHSNIVARPEPIWTLRQDQTC